MPTNVGLKLGIEGESKYKSELNNIIQQAKTLDSEMKAVTSSFTKETSAEEKAAKTTEVLTKQIDVQKQKLDAQNAMLERAIEKYGEADTRTLSWRDAVNNTTATLNKMENELAGVADGVEDTTDEMKDGTTAGMSFGDMLKANITADAIIGGVKALASAFAEVAKEIVNTVKESMQLADNLKTTAVQTGLTTDQLQELEYMSGLIDVDVSTVTGSLRKLTMNMDKAADGTGDAADAFGTLGVSVTDADGNLRDNYDVFLDVIDALGTVENQTERDSLSMAIFGRNAQELNTIVAAGSSALEQYAQEAHDVGYVMDTETIDTLVAAQDAADRLSNQFTAFKNTVVAQFAPDITAALSDVLSLLQGDMSLEEFISNIQEKIPEVVETITGLIMNITDGIIEHLPEIIEAGINILLSLLTGIIEALPQLIARIPEIITGIVTALLKAIPQIIIVGGKLILNLIKGIWDYWNNLDEQITNIGRNLVEGIMNGISNGFEWIKGKLKEWVSNVLKYIKDLFGISSPSKITAGYGVMLDQGLAVGILKSAGAINKAWAQATGGIGAINANISGGAAAAGGMSVVFNITQRDGEDGQALAARINRQLGRIYA